MGSGRNDAAGTSVRRPRVVVADDHRIMLEGLHALLQDRYHVVACVASADALVEATQWHGPDVVVSDVSMPASGIETARKLRELAPHTAIVLLTQDDNPTLAASALRLGVKGYVLKSETFERLELAIDAALAGRIYLSSALARETFTLFSPPLAPDLRPDMAALTNEQLVVLRLLGRGLTTLEIAKKLYINPRTVSFHKYRIMEILGAKSTAELIRKAAEDPAGRLLLRSPPETHAGQRALPYPTSPPASSPASVSAGSSAGGAGAS